MKPIFHLLRELPLLAAECSLHMLGMIPKSTPSLPTLLPFRSCIHWDVGQGSGSEQDTLGCFLCAVRWREQPVRENTKWWWSGTEKACFSLSVFLRLWILDHPMAGESFLGIAHSRKGCSCARHASGLTSLLVPYSLPASASGMGKRKTMC